MARHEGISVQGKADKRCYSKRTEKGTLEVVKRRCEECGHHKCFRKNRGLQCTKCGRWQNENKKR